MAYCVTGCATKSPAPIVDRPVEQKRTASTLPTQAPLVQAQPQQLPQKSPETQAQPGFHEVQKGETLFSIAFQHGLDYREVAQWNGIEDPNVLHAGQRLRLTAPEGAPVATPLAAGSGVVVTPLSSASPPSATKVDTPSAPATSPASAASSGAALKSEPKAIKQAYSDQALSRLQNPTSDKPKTDAKVETKVETKIEPKVDAKADAKTPAKTPDTKTSASSEDNIEWMWPTKGKPKVLFTDTTKGIDILGARGQPVVAVASGKVIHVGSNLRGYGKLVIIQHTPMFLSAYAHNNQVLVKAGDRVTKGQKIAEMGDSDTDQVKLHFEIRRFGKPVDPLKYLPEEKAS